MSLTCLHGSSGVWESDGPNVLKPSASEGQARPALGHPLLLCQPQSKTGPATAEKPRSKNKGNQNCSQTSPRKDRRHRLQLLTNIQHAHMKGLIFHWNVFRDIKAVREGKKSFLLVLKTSELLH